MLLGLALVHFHDAATVYYRSRPFMLASELTPQEAFAADMAMTGSPSEGRDVGVVYSMPPRGAVTVLPSSGDVGAQYTPAVGWAQAITYYQKSLGDKSWQGALAVALGGDGSVATNGFWSALTIATTMKLPMLFFIEDNGYGISVPGDFQTPGGNIAENLASFGNLQIYQGSGTDPERTPELVHMAVAHVRAGKGACLLRVEVPRLTGHTFGEDQSAYKTKRQIAAEHKRDPLTTLRDYLGQQFDCEALAAKVEKEVRAGLKAAESNADPEVDSASEHLFFTGIHPQVPPPDASQPSPDFEQPPSEESARINFSEAVRKVMDS